MSTCRRLVLLTLLALLTGLMLGLGAVGSARAERTAWPDGYLERRAPPAQVLVVMVAGLAGEDTWTGFAALFQPDRDLQRMDLLVYHAPPAFDIDEHAERLESLLATHGPRYARLVIVGHSIGGIIVKRMLLRRLAAPGQGQIRPGLVMTLGTPLDTDKFSISVFRQLGASVFWPLVPPLRREVFQVERLKDINQAWRAAAGSPAFAGMRRVAVFGVDDDIAPVREERPGETTVFIRGDHLGIVTPKDASACGYLLLKTLAVDPAADPRALACVLK